jgi:hypothetical protein
MYCTLASDMVSQPRKRLAARTPAKPAGRAPAGHAWLCCSLPGYSMFPYAGTLPCRTAAARARSPHPGPRSALAQCARFRNGHPNGLRSKPRLRFSLSKQKFQQGLQGKIPQGFKETTNTNTNLINTLEFWGGSGGREHLRRKPADSVMLACTRLQGLQSATSVPLD